jgi:hypothetical protein
MEKSPHLAVVEQAWGDFLSLLVAESANLLPGQHFRFRVNEECKGRRFDRDTHIQPKVEIGGVIDG